MEQEFPVWLLLALPIAFGLGWLASRLDLRQLRTENRSAPKAYFKGLNYLLNEQQDQAIDAFIEAVQKDPDTSELHFALGNLFRRRGEYERAVRVHQHLLGRADLSTADRDRAQYALAMDFLKAGLLDHAETALRVLENSPARRNQAQMALLGIYERSRDWEQAGKAAEALEQDGENDFSKRRAHFLCERADAARKLGDLEGARALLQQALQTAPDTARPRLLQAELDLQQGHAEQAYATLLSAMQQLPAFAPLMAGGLARLAIETGQIDAARTQLEASQRQNPSIDLVEALVQLDQAQNPEADSSPRYLAHLQEHPSLIAATRWLDLEKLKEDTAKPCVDRALQHAIRPLARYRCAACGFEAQHHYWHCPGCQSWDSYPPRRIEEL